MNRIKVKGHRVRGTLNGKPYVVTLWSWGCPKCGAWNCNPGWRGVYEEARGHAGACQETPVQLVYAVRLPDYTMYVDPDAVFAIPGTSHDAFGEDGKLAVRYMDFKPDTGRHWFAAVSVVTDHGLRTLDMTLNAGLRYQEAYVDAKRGEP